MGQLTEWPEVVTKGRDPKDCRAMLRDVLHEMILAHAQQHKEIPLGNALLEQLPIEVAESPAPSGKQIGRLMDRAC
jgi:hypothetical protein